MNNARFKSWQIVRIRGRGPYSGSAWRIAAHVYRERAINCMDAITRLQQDIHVWEDAYDQLQRTADQLTSDLTAAWANGKTLKEESEAALARAGSELFSYHKEVERLRQLLQDAMDVSWVGTSEEHQDEVREIKRRIYHALRAGDAGVGE